MIELRWLWRYETKNDPYEGRCQHPIQVLQYRNLLSQKAKLGIQSQTDADIAEESEKWKDVPTEFEFNHARGSDL